MNYPKRESFFAHKFVRLLTKSCAAQDIGLNAFSLLCVIVHQEDSARYCGPVRFWNEQLMSTLSLSPRALRDARDKAIKFGWLVYQREHDRSTGRYFVTVPEKYERLSDAPIEEPIRFSGDVSGDVSGEVTSDGSGDASGADLHKEVTSNRTRSEHESAPEPSPPSIPIPVPCPVPKNKATTCSPDVVIPESMNREDVLTAVQCWFDYLEPIAPQKVPPDNSPQLQAFWNKSVRYGPDILMQAIEHAMAEGWIVLRDAEQYRTKGNGNGNNQTRLTASQHRENANASAFDSIRAAIAASSE